MAVQDITGYLWRTAEPISFAATGAHVPAIPLVRDAGPVVLYMRFTRVSDSGAILSLRNSAGDPFANGWFNLPLITSSDYGSEVKLRSSGTELKTQYHPAPPYTSSMRFTVVAGTGASNVLIYDPSHGEPYWTGTLPEVVASDEIRIGHSVDGNTGELWFRAAGTLHRAAIFARSSLTTAEESEVLAWLASDAPEQPADPPVEGTVVAQDQLDLASGLAGTVAWPTRTGTITAQDQLDLASGLAGTVAWPTRTGTIAAQDQLDAATATGSVYWPAIGGTLTASDLPDAAAGFEAVLSWPVATGTITASDRPDVATGFSAGLLIGGVLLAVDSADLAAITGSVTWPTRIGTLSATDSPDNAALVGGIRVSGNATAADAPDAVEGIFGQVVAGGTLAASDTEDAASSIVGQVYWPGAGMRLVAADTLDAATGFTGKVLVAGTITATDQPDAANFTGGSAWTPIIATLAAVDEGDAASLMGVVSWGGVRVTIAAGDLLDGAEGFTARLPIQGTVIATGRSDVSVIVGQLVVSGIVAANDRPDRAEFAGGEYHPTLRLYPGQYVAGRVLQAGNGRLLLEPPLVGRLLRE